MLKFSIFSIISLILLSSSLAASPPCNRPAPLTEAEEICWTSTVEVLDRIQYTTKSVFNFAKKKLGFNADEPDNPQKCNYYECIFKELKMLTSKSFPSYTRLVEWIDSNIIYNYAKEIYEQLNKCNAALARSITSNTFFSANLTDTLQTELPPLQGTCDVSEEFIKCLNAAKTDCVIFKYP